jgi:hypothetical protein
LCPKLLAGDDLEELNRIGETRACLRALNPKVDTSSEWIEFLGTLSSAGRD